MNKSFNSRSMDLTKYPPVIVNEETPKTLILGPNRTLQGGVAGYYNTLKLEDYTNARYFAVNSAKPQSGIITFFRLIANYFRFIYIIIKDRYQLIHINPSLERRSFYRDSVFIIMARMLNRKTLVFFRGWIEPFEQEIRKSKLKSFIFRISYAKADKYIVLSSLFKNKIKELGAGSKAEFFNETTVADSSYIDELDLEKKYLSFQEKVIFLFLSRVEKEKGIYITIDAYQQFLRENPERKSSLLVAGEGPDLTVVKKYVEDLKIPDVEFLGYISGEKKKKALLESHVLIFPSYTEGMPNSILEAMLFGMPVISREIGGIPDVIRQKENGFLTDSLQPAIFAKFLSMLASDNELYKEIAKNNHRIAAEQYITPRVRERILKIYESFRR